MSDKGFRICDLCDGEHEETRIFANKTRSEITVGIADDLSGVIRSAKERKSAGCNVNI